MAPLIRYVAVRSPNRTMKNIRVFFISSLLGAALSFAGTPTFEAQPSPELEEETSHDLFSYETTYTFRSDFKESKLGHVNSLFNDFSYDHRFLITGNWYFRAGVEYERYDFSGTDNGLPDHLQAAMAHVALEYIIKNHAGVGIEIDPGFSRGRSKASAAWKLSANRRDGCLPSNPIVASTVRRTG